MPTEELQGQIALVSGAANGIGRACALQLAGAGADLALFDIDAAGLTSLANEISRSGVRTSVQHCDCTAPAELEQAIDRALTTLGPADILVNNVGQSARERAGEFWLSDESVWRFVFEISLFTTLRASRRVVPSMRERGRGRIINISSDAALAGDTGLVDYASAKMGVLGFTRSLARELAPFQVTVNALCPGAIRTRAHQRLPEATLDRIRASVPMGFVGDPEDVARMVVFLAGPGGRYITGQSILIDGGRWMV